MRRAVAWSGAVGAAGAVAWLAGGTGGDTYRFVAAGRTLLSAHWDHAFASKFIQAGPLQLAVFGSIGRSGTALAVALALTTTVLLLATAEAVGVRNPVVIGALGLFAVAAGFMRPGSEWGHPEYAVLPLIWSLSAVSVRRGRFLRAGVLLGLSAGLATWGILGVAVLALAPRRGDAVKGALAACAVSALLFAPFVFAGHFAMGSYSWPVRHPAFLSLFLSSGPNGATFGWPLRLLQGAAALSAGIVAARLLRHSPHAPWIVALAVAAVRLLLDPLFLPYYRPAIEGPVFVGAALLATQLGALRRRQESFA